MSLENYEIRLLDSSTRELVRVTRQAENLEAAKRQAESVVIAGARRYRILLHGDQLAAGILPDR